MNSQNTPIHLHLWHRDFWYMITCNLLLSVAVYLMVPFFPSWLAAEGLSDMYKGIAMLLFPVGIVIAGPHVSYLLERYARKGVCCRATLALALLMAAMFLVGKGVIQLPTRSLTIAVAMLFRLFSGMAFGIAQISLRSTLIIDKSESNQRTEANYASSWFGRFSLSLGPFAALLVCRLTDSSYVFLTGAALALVCWLFLLRVPVPFKTPKEDISRLSLDRFFLPQGFWLFLNFILVMIALGLLLAMPLTTRFYGMLMVGFLIAILSQRVVFQNADLKSEVVTGIILLMAALLIMLHLIEAPIGFLPPALIGLGIGLIATRFLMFFLKLSKHCQRGTSQSTYIIAWELGLGIGLFIGYGLLHSEKSPILCCSLGLVIIALLMYNLFTHKWFMEHKNR